MGKISLHSNIFILYNESNYLFTIQLRVIEYNDPLIRKLNLEQGFFVMYLLSLNYLNQIILKIYRKSTDQLRTKVVFCSKIV